MTALTVIAVMTPSPIPISRWTPTIATATVDTDVASLPPIAYCSVKPSAASGTERPAAIPAAATIDDFARGRTVRRPTNTT